MTTNSRATVFTNVENHTLHVLRWVNGGVMFALGFVILHYVGYILSWHNAHYLGFEPTVSFEGLSNLRNTSGWGPRSIAFVYLMPAALGLAVFIPAILFFFKVSRNRTIVRNFLFWLSLNGYLLFYSYFLFGIIGSERRLTDFYGSYAAVFDWLYWTKETTIVSLTALSVIFLLAGLIFAPMVMALHHSQSVTLFKNSGRVIFSNVVMIPFSIGALVILVASFPMDFDFVGVRILSAMLLFIACFLFMKLIPDGNIVIVKGGIKCWSWYVVIPLAVLLVLTTRLLFSQSI